MRASEVGVVVKEELEALTGLKAETVSRCRDKAITGT